MTMDSEIANMWTFEASISASLENVSNRRLWQLLFEALESGTGNISELNGTYFIL